MINRELGKAGSEYPGIQFGDVQKFVKEFVHGSDRGVDSGNDPSSLSRIAFVAQLRHEPVQDVKRLPQIMPRSRYKAGLSKIVRLKFVIETSQLLGHPVHIGRQSAQLVAILD